MKRIMRLSAALFISLGLLASAFAQEEVFQRGIEFGVGARALGMGGAYIGVGDDYSASYWNPAALTQIRRLEGFATLSHAQRTDDATFGALGVEDETSFTRLNNFGLAYPIPTYRGSLVFSIGYNRVRPYDSNFEFSWFNDSSDNLVNQRWSELEEGGLNNWTIAGATEIAPNLSVGASVNFWNGKDDYQFSFVEQDINDIYTFASYRNDQNIISEFSGVNAKISALYHASSLLRVGFTLSTPTTLKVIDSWVEAEETNFDDGSREESRDRGGFEYKIRSPLSMGVGASVNLLGLLVSGNLELNDWTQIRYTTEPPIIGLSKAEANDELARNYRSTARVRLGAELTLPIIDVQVRGGYMHDPTPLADLPTDADREFLTAGLGIFLDKQARLDLAFVTGEWNDYKAPLDDFNGGTVPVSEKITLNKAFASLAFRF